MYITGVQTAIVVENSIWVVDRNTGYLFEINLLTWEIEKSIELEELYFDSFRVSHLYKNDNYIWILPLNMRKIGRYNLDSEELKFYELKEIGAQFECSYVQIYKDDIFFFPRDLKSHVYKYSIISEDVQIDHMWDGYFGVNKSNVIKMVTATKTQLFICFTHSSEILGYDYEKNLVNNIRVNEVDEIVGIACDNNLVCIVGKEKDQVYLWDCITKDIVRINSSEMNAHFCRPVFAGDIIKLSDCRNLYTLQNNKIFKDSIIENLINDSDVSGFFLYSYRWKERYIFPPCHANMFCVYDTSGRYVNGKMVEIPEDIVKKHINRLQILKECCEIKLEEFINLI